MTGPGLEIERLRSPEVAAALERGFRTVVFSCGAVEQHGPHLPMFMDAEHGTRLAVAVAERLGRALVGPTIRVGCSEHHMAFPGSMSVRPQTLEALCTDYCRSFARHAFERVCIIPSHGGNFAPLTEMLPRLRDAVGPSCRVDVFQDLVTVITAWRKTVERVVPGLGERVGGHADIAETSLMLAFHPDLVRMDLAEEGFHPEMDGSVFDRIIREGFRSVTPNGILGDARGSSAAIGEAALADLADVVAEFFRGAYR